MEELKNNFRLVHFTIRKYGFRTSALYDYDDLFQIGCIGLWEAIKRYDKTKKCKFSTYATFWIRAELERAKTYSMRQRRQVQTVSIDKPLPDGQQCFRDLLPDVNNLEEEVIASDLREWLLKKEPELISLRLQGLTQAQIGERIGVSPQRVGAKLKRLKEVALCAR